MTATAAYGGFGGAVSIDGNPLAEVQNWTADVHVKIGDATSMNSEAWYEGVVLLKGGTAKYVTLQDGGKPGLVINLTLKTKSSGGVSIAGDALITNKKVTTDLGLVKFEYDAKFTGAITSALVPVS
jgi:hypothetical protein